MSQSTAPSPSPEPQAFLDATTWKSRGPAHFEGEIDELWGQGRAIYGGIVGAGMVRAMRNAVPATEHKRLRSISVSFAGPVDAGSVACDTRVVRAGRSASFVESEITQAGATRATAAAIYGLTRPSSLQIAGPTRPDVPPPDGLDSMPYIDGLMPRFTQRFEFRYARGGYPFTGSTLNALGGWCRFRHDSDPGDEAGILALLDSWPSPAISAMRTPAPSSSITWDVDLFALRPDCAVDQWWYFDAVTTFAGEGYSSFDASLWAPDGQFVARSRQLVGIFDRPAAT